ncbi:MAG TPA: PxKF domain-containing protein [Gaiellaceae bacterium]|nr:PxKF domain-containing protein [Gaiellaceae bacterium]
MRATRRWVGLAFVLGALLALAGGAGAAEEFPPPDSITPATVDLSLGKGSSATVDSSLHLAPAPPRADILLALDTTGSMGAAIADAENDANAMVSQIQAAIPGARFAVADFKDYPTSPFGNSGDYPWRVDQDFTANGPSDGCEAGTEIACALDSLTAGGGNDEPEAYNRAFYEAGNDTHLHWADGAPRFMVVLGDSLPHDQNLGTDFAPRCPSTSLTDPGSAFSVNDLSYPDVGPLHTAATLAALKQRHTNVSFVTYNEPHLIGGLDVAGCQAAMAEFTGGSGVVHGNTDSLKNQIVALINAAAAHVESVTFDPRLVSPEGADVKPTFTFDPPTLGPISAPADIAYEMTVSVPDGTPSGDYVFTVHAIADGSDRAQQQVTVHVSNKSVSSLQLTADQSSVPAGIAAAPYSSIPASRLGLLSPDTASAPAGSIPAGSIPAGSIPAGSIPAGSIPAGSIPAGSIPAGSIGFDSLPAGSIPAGSIGLQRIFISQIPLVGTTWSAILGNSTLALQPLQAVSLDAVAHDATVGTDGRTPWQRLTALPSKSFVYSTSLWRNIPYAAFMLGNAKLDTLPTPLKADGTTRYASWRDAISQNGGDLTGVDTSQNTALGVAIAGQLGSTPAGSIPAGSIPAGSIPAGSIPAGSIEINATSLRTVLVSDITPATGKTLADYVNCSGSVGGFTCPAGSTLGQADTAGAINPALTLDQLFASLPAGSIGRQTTVDQIIQAMLSLSDYPWEQIKVQGLQDVAGTGQNVRYHADFDLACPLATQAKVTVNLPNGFFVVPGSAQVSYDNGTAIPAPNPTGADPSTPVWNTLPGTPCPAGSGGRHVRLDFTSFAGLTLGSQSASVSVTALNGEIGAGTYSSANQAPVLVTQNWEPSGDPATAPVIQRDTLIVGHIASSNDVDYFRFSLGGLAPGTKVAAYLKTAPGTDLDLVLNKPNAPTVQPNPAGSIPAGSIGIEDSDPGVDNSRGALPPDTLADVPAGSIPAGSIPAGSIPAGSISANRGAVNEAVDIVTHGETGNAVIGVSGYNGAFSSGNYVLRVKVTPPPTLPACQPITNLAPTLAVPSALPSSLPASTQALFLVDRQRLAGMYGVDRMNTLMNSADFATVRGQVNGQVLQIDGSAAVRSAYAAWDANPCAVDAANAVVTAINGVVGTYRPSLPNLKYVILVGSDQALPSWRLSDLTSLSPEVDNAQELAFTTDGLTKGNSTYASSALNTVLTDQAYGNFGRVPFLGQDLPLAQVSVSRLVETPEEIAGQFTQYLAASGQLNVQSALTTGDDFFVDGGQETSAALGAQFGLTSSLDTLFPPASAWTRQDLLDHFFQKSGGVPGVGALYAHYNHWLMQPASLPATPTVGDFPTSADVRQSQLIFTIGCHGGFSLPDTVGGPIAADDLKRQLDWAQAYSRSRTAVYVANTGFGYGDTKTVDLSERLMRGFARTLYTGGTIGEQWVRALHDYYATAGAYDVVDEKVMVEANMYGLPFYGFTGTQKSPPPVAPTPTTRNDNGLTAALLPALSGANITQHVQPDGTSLFFDDSQPDGTTNAGGIRSGTLSVIYRPIQPQLSRDVTVPGVSAHGAFITSLQTATFTGVKPAKPFPLVFNQIERPRTDYPNIFFPAGMVTVNRDLLFGQERATAVVNMGRFRPDATGDLGTEQVVRSIGLDIGYSNSSDITAPLITQVGAVKTSGGFTAFVRVTDDSGSLHHVAVLWSDGGPTWHVTDLTHGSGDLWTASIASTAASIFVDGEAQDGAGNVGFSFNKAVNFQSTEDTTNPSIVIAPPLPNATYALGQQVNATFDCSDAGAVQSCIGQADAGGPIQSGGLLYTGSVGQHTFTVTATDLAGHTTTQTVTYTVVFGFTGFRPPVDNPPVLNVDNAGRTIPIKWALTNASGAYYTNLNAVQAINQRQIRCPNASTDPISSDVPVGLSGLRINGTDFQFNWATDRAWAGTCRRLSIRLSDGTTIFADFQFR